MIPARLSFPGLLLLALCSLLARAPLHAQDTSSVLSDAVGIDTTAFYDSILHELRTLGLLGNGRRSFVDVNAGLGNGSFALQNQGTEVQTGHLFFNTGVGYYHKSGLSLSSGFNFTSDQGRFTLYQAYVSPSYDYQSHSVAFGFSAYRYFNQPDLSFYVSPLVNELYGYVAYRKWWLQPKLAIDYGWGKYDELEALQFIDTNRYRRFAPVVRYLSRQERMATVSDFSLLLTLRHDFLTSSRRHHLHTFRYTPSITVLAGTSQYGTNTPLSSLSGPRLAANTSVQLFRQWYETALTPPPASFQLQNINISQSAAAYLGKLYLQAQLVFSYTLPAERSGWTVFYNLGTGINL